MKTTRTLLIEQAARDDADEGTEWRERMEAWMDESNRVNRRWVIADLSDSEMFAHRAQ